MTCSWIRVRPNRSGAIAPRTVTACPWPALVLAREANGRTPAPAAASSRKLRRFMLDLIYRDSLHATRKFFDYYLARPHMPFSQNPLDCITVSAPSTRVHFGCLTTRGLGGRSRT